MCYTFGKRQFEVLDLKQFKEVKEQNVVIFSFGEIDCRCHVKRHCKDGDYKSVIDPIIENYINAINANVNQFASLKTCVLSVTPAVKKNGCLENPDYPFEGSDEERKLYVKYFNKQLSAKCIKHKYTFIDIYDLYADSQGFLKTDLSDGNVHIKNPAPLFMTLKLYKII